MQVLKMPVAKKEGGAYVSVGSVDVPVFDLEEFGINIAPTGKDDEGLLTYEDPKIQYVYDALTAATKADARNKLVSGSVALKAGSTIAATVDELIAKAERSGAALQIAREFIASFTAYLASKSGKSASVQALYTGMVKNRQTIALSSQPRKDGLLAQLEGYVTSASQEDAAKYANILGAIAELCNTVVTLDDDEL